MRRSPRCPVEAVVALKAAGLLLHGGSELVGVALAQSLHQRRAIVVRNQQQDVDTIPHAACVSHVDHGRQERDGML